MRAWVARRARSASLLPPDSRRRLALPSPMRSFEACAHRRRQTSVASTKKRYKLSTRFEIGSPTNPGPPDLAMNCNLVWLRSKRQATRFDRRSRVKIARASLALACTNRASTSPPVSSRKRSDKCCARLFLLAPWPTPWRAGKSRRPLRLPCWCTPSSAAKPRAARLSRPNEWPIRSSPSNAARFPPRSAPNCARALFRWLARAAQSRSNGSLPRVV